MTTNLFVEWYDKTFIPEVQKFRENIGKFGKELLLVDNAAHPRSKLSESENGKLIVTNRGITETLRKLYRKQPLRRLLL
jgi:hypothetical protein